MITYEEYKELKRQQDRIVDELSDVLNSYKKGPMGLVEDSVKDDNFRLAKMRYKVEFNKLRNIHALGYKLFKKQIYEEHELRRKGNKPE